jgi:hypothetical protein
MVGRVGLNERKMLAPEGRAGGAVPKRRLFIDQASYVRPAWKSHERYIINLFGEITDQVLLNQTSLSGRPQNIADLVFSVTEHKLRTAEFSGSFYVEIKAADGKNNELAVKGNSGVFGVEEIENILQSRRMADFLRESGLVVSLATERNFRKNDNTSSVWLIVKVRDC